LDPLNADIERGYKSKTPRVKVDNERFVDLQQLLQRRYDDESKCRMVKREIKPSFDGCVVALIGALSRPDADIIKLISDNGGLVAQFITHHVTIAVCGSSPAASDVAEAHLQGIPVVTDDIIDEIIQVGFKNVDIKRFGVPSKPAAPSAVVADSLIEKGSKWSGVFTDSTGTMVPLELVINMRHKISGVFAGELRRPTWKNLKTRVRGSFVGSNLKLEELSLVSGGVSGKLPQFPVVFEGSLSDKQMRLSSGSSQPCSLELTLLPAARGSFQRPLMLHLPFLTAIFAGASKTPLQMLTTGSSFEGSLTQIGQVSLEFNSGSVSTTGSITSDGECFSLRDISETGNGVTFSHDLDGMTAQYTLSVLTDNSGRGVLSGTKTDERGGRASVKINL
jgi:hypothetical protein